MTLTQNSLFCFFIALNCFLFTACTTKSSNKANEVKIENFKEGEYNHSSFKSKVRGKVDFNVYLPPTWSKNIASKYPLIILLHGQGEDEHTFTGALPKDSLNSWIKKGLIPETVFIALRGGKNTNEMQWYTDQNEEMITSLEKEELRNYCNKNFNTSLKATKISVIGHSRGATGALNFALYFPSKFASVVSSAFVSDYALKRLKQATDQNKEKIIESGIKINLLIGSKDQYVLNNNRKGSPLISSYLKEKGISNQLETIEGKTHRVSDLWEYPINLKYIQSCAESWK